MSSRSVITATVGYLCLALTGWLVSIINAGWLSREMYGGGGLGIMVPLAIILGVMGILAFLHDGALDSIVFFGGAGLIWSGRLPMESGGYSGWFFLVWAVFFLCVWLGSFRAAPLRMLFLLVLALTLIALAIASWVPSHAFTVIGGYLGLINSLIALFIAANAVRSQPAAPVA